MNKIIFLLFSILLLSNSVSAVDGGILRYDFTQNMSDSFQGAYGDMSATDNNIVYVTGYPLFNTTGSGSTHAGSFDGSTGVFAISPVIAWTNDTSAVSFWLKSDGDNANDYIYLYVKDNNVESSFAGMYQLTGGNLNIYTSAGCGGGTAYDTGFNPDSGVWYHIVVVREATQNTTWFYVNGTLIGTSTNPDMWKECGTSGDSRILISKYPVAGTFGLAGDIDRFDIYDYNLTEGEILNLYNTGALIVTALSITNSTLNMTSDGGCLAWRTDKTSTCNTTDGTPTIEFDTSKTASCSISTSQTSYNSSLDCSTTGGTSHVCTLYNEDKLDFGLSDIYASCEISGGAENDTTGAMNINMTAGGGGAGLVACISAVGDGCGAVISNNCATII